ncbi:protein HOTHEAD-like isoform X1 [Dioscorea cayenensis subsp. rotundata]|uniref:Protein HOTHEAD-like isoform X1 n=1 Tax=Dioscorea cayennensis subsp. rotundata TaxID=55577 RepID=A0AB40CRF1_DIOCR|nr:protein HOTHEAD-like isoform X1 [Dioscorea cayenensis subsp. rotundata]
MACVTVGRTLTAWKKDDLFLFRFIFILVSLYPCHGNFSQANNKQPNFRNASSFSTMPNLPYDYIVVGGGTAGCPLAATLSEKFRVLVLERGGSPYGNANISRLENYDINLAHSTPTSPVQRFLSTDGVFNHRARVLGGNTCINGGFYSRAQPSFVRNAGWDEVLVNESYKWVEDKIVFLNPAAPWQSAVKDGFLEVGVTPFNGYTYQHINGTKFGGSIFDNNGFRHTAADLLAAGNPRNLDVLIYANAEKIIFDTKGTNSKAIGVIFIDENDNRHEAFIKADERSEVILTSGAIGTPQLLLLSGVGPEEDLRKMNITVILNNEHVGKEMADVPSNNIQIPTPEPQKKTLAQVVGITTEGFYVETISGISQNNDSIVTVKNGNMSELKEVFRGGSIHKKIIGPLSKGNLSLINTNVTSNPAVTFNYYAEPEDLRRCVTGVSLLLKIAKTRPVIELMGNLSYTDEMLLNMSVNLFPNLIPKSGNETKSLPEFCKRTVTTLWHYHGGCIVGKVVDKDYKIIGVGNLRVGDSSLFVESPGTNPQATVMMLGRMMGVKMITERGRLARDHMLYGHEGSASSK